MKRAEKVPNQLTGSQTLRNRIRTRRLQVRRRSADVEVTLPLELTHLEHVTDDELERHLMASTAKGPDVDRIQEHLLGCEECMDRSKDIELYLKVTQASAEAVSGKKVRL